MFEEFFKIYKKCDRHDAKLRRITTRHNFRLWFNDYDYFEEEFREYNNPEAIWELTKWLNENCISKSHFPIAYNFENFTIYIAYVSEVF